jgi:hypothetical protein
MTYNGWTNYETWLTNLHVFDGVTAQDLGYDAPMSWKAVRDYAMECLGDPDSHNPFVADMINGFLGEVNWYELAEHLNSEFTEQEVEELQKGELTAPLCRVPGDKTKMIKHPLFYHPVGRGRAGIVTIV